MTEIVLADWLTARAPVPSPQVTSRFDPELAALWLYIHPRPRPSFNPEFLSEFGAQTRRIQERRGVELHGGREHAIEYAVAASSVPGVFSYGGDLALFRAAILDGDRDALVRYGRQCVDILHTWYHQFGLPITTIALVQGEALGGGLEAALAPSVLVAEESARLGFPEIRFNLFPGMGAYSFLARKVGRRTAETMMSSGAIYSARALHEMGVVDVLVPDGTGEAAVGAWIRDHARSGNGRRGLERVRCAIEPLPRAELYDVVDIWADTALQLRPRDLLLMDRLVRAQERGATRPGERDPVAWPPHAPRLALALG